MLDRIAGKKRSCLVEEHELEMIGASGLLRHKPHAVERR
jgi:hypothetical protein